MGSLSDPTSYSPVKEAERIFGLLCDQADQLDLPASFTGIKKNVMFKTDSDRVYFPIPFKETETTSALKGVEGGVASALAELRTGKRNREIKIDLEKATSFLFQSYLATVGGLGKQDEGVKLKLKGSVWFNLFEPCWILIYNPEDTDLLQAQSNPYRRMSANLYETKEPGRYYHIHGSLEANTTLEMIGLQPFRPDLKDHDDIVMVIESAVKSFTVHELEDLNAKNKQAGVEAMKYRDFITTPHGRTNTKQPPWTITCLESDSAPVPLPASSEKPRILEGIKVLEVCRIIAGPTVARILGEYGADVLKVTSPHLSDVPFFQVDGNMGKHTTDLDLKSPEGRKIFEQLLADVDIIVDGYRPGAFDKLGYGPKALAEMGKKRGKGIIYVNENCFGYEGEWANRAGWQQIADCVTGVAWAQGKFIDLNEPMVPPFPISDYRTGCMGAIAALTCLYNRSTRGGSWHGKVSLLQYDLLLFTAGQYSPAVQDQLRKTLTPEFLALKHSHSVDQISKTALAMMRKEFPALFDKSKYCETWFSERYGEDVCAVKPVVEIEGVEIGWVRGSRPNGSDAPSWDFGKGGDFKR
ncbi:Succinyl-L-malate -transferase beta subunit [Hyphodiscus hymeniophilus]|uniref:Succinyl-L-malate -transferase beta subunit n=1 Tax=Hyphodiscus hymeniophilus TaxID=353542 RepID=A0A9P7AXD9_9HELO|nr:Succinyl-L-malate -transferase beta subunit [Hyphodiscus hymeniophilus]